MRRCLQGGSGKEKDSGERPTWLQSLQAAGCRGARLPCGLEEEAENIAGIRGRAPLSGAGTRGPTLTGTQGDAADPRHGHWS